MQSKKQWTPAVRNEYALQYYKDNKGYYKDYYKKYREENKEAIKEYQRNYRLEQKLMKEEEKLLVEEPKENPTSRKGSIHSRTVRILELDRPLGIEVLLTPFFKELKEYKLEMQKPYSAILHCTITELKEHIESQFEEGMTWKNIDIANKNKTYHFKNLYPVWMQNK